MSLKSNLRLSLFILISVAGFLSSLLLVAQNIPNKVTKQNRISSKRKLSQSGVDNTIPALNKKIPLENHFPSSEKMPHGTYYYPEHWSKTEWERDIKHISEMGFTFTHFAEFAWAKLEPQEGQFNFGWLDTAVALCQKYNLKVIMCTPTPCPPVWLTTKYPQVLMENANGRTLQHGSRAHYSWDSPLYQKYCQRVVTAMAKHYGNNPAIWGWQIDNEPSHYSKYDYSEASQIAFRSWLENKYGTIDKLNNTWGTAFWSQTYLSFSQIRCPNESELVVQPNPSAMLDFERFYAAGCAKYITMQAQTLRTYIAKNQWVTTNYMSATSHLLVNPSLTNESLDLPTFTSYPVAGGYGDGLGEDGFRLGGPYYLAFNQDYFRCINGKTAIMELQPGQVNWGKYSPQPLPGAINMYLWQTWAAGSVFVCNYRLRQPLSGAEQYYSSVLGPDGVTPNIGGAEWIKTIADMNAVITKATVDKTIKIDTNRNAAIVFNLDNIFDINNQRQSSQFNPIDHAMKYYKALRNLGMQVDIISDTTDLNKYKVVIAPAFQLLTSKIITKWQKYAQQGGQLILTCRTGQKDTNGNLFPTLLQQSIAPLIGGQVQYFDALPDNRMGKLDFNNKTYTYNNWADVIDAKTATVVGAYSSQFYKGKAAILEQAHGKGQVTYVGVDTDTGILEQDVIAVIYKKLDINILNLPDGVLLQKRAGLFVAINYGPTPYTFSLAPNAEILLGSTTISQAGVLVYKLK